MSEAAVTPMNVSDAPNPGIIEAAPGATAFRQEQCNERREERQVDQGEDQCGRVARTNPSMPRRSSHSMVTRAVTAVAVTSGAEPQK